MAHSVIQPDLTAAQCGSRRWSAHTESPAADFGWASERCLRTGPQHLDCDHCARACPEQALQFVEDDNQGTVLQATDACHGCGACLPTCPTEALLSRSLNSLERVVEISLERVVENSLERVVETSPERFVDNSLNKAPTPLTLNCHRVRPASDSKPLHCLRMLGPDLLHEWVAALGPSQLTLCVAEDCQHCPAAPKVPLAADWWSTAHTLNLLQTTPGVAFRPAPGPMLSRRQLLSGTALQPPVFPADSAPVAARRLQRRHAADPEHTPLPALHLDPDRCDSSQVCSRVCPTTALTVSAEGSLRFNPLECLACGHCTDHCPEQALRMETSTASQPRELNHFTARRCFSCGHEFTLPRPGQIDSDVCPACQRDRALLQDDFHRLFF